MKNSIVTRSLAGVVKKNILLSMILFISICGVVFASLVPPQLLKYIVDKCLLPRSYDNLMLLAGAYIGVLVLAGLFDFVKEALITILGQKITKGIRMEMMKKLGRLSAGYFSSNSSGTIVSRFTNDVDAINSLFTSGIIGMAVDLFKVIGIVASIWILSPKLGVVTLFLLPVIYAVTRIFQRKMLKAQILNRVLVGRVNNHISESFKNILMIKAFSKEDFMERNYSGYLMDNFRTVEKVNFYDSVFSPIIQLTRAVVISLIVVLSSGQLNYLGITLGMVAASIELISNLFAPVENLGMELQNIQQAVSGIKRVDDFNNEPEDSIKNEDLKAADIITAPRGAGISFNNVTFSYDEQNDVLRNIELCVKPNEKVTFAGRTGVGKSTLFKLVMGLLKPSSGSITVNGTDVFDIPNSEKRKIFGYVDQNFHIIKGTVADQISLQDESITRHQIEHAVDFVGMSEYISSLEKGLDTIVTGDALFSQGQKQLLAIARAIVNDPPVLLLDEITANLDSITEGKIISVLQKAGDSHTILSISHRLSSIINSDTVVILENGRVKNAGSPDELLQKDEWYRSHIAMERLTWS